jgi:mono/diheme cytochrome c family protein
MVFGSRPLAAGRPGIMLLICGDRRRRAVPAVAGAVSSEPIPNLDDPAVIQAGQKLFEERQCAYCHCPDGDGGVKLRSLGNLDPAEVFATIADGRISGDLRMLAWRGVLSDKDIWEAVAYVLVLSHSSR